MPFKLYYLPSYERCLKRLGSRERHLAGLVVSALSRYLGSQTFVFHRPFVVALEGRSYRLVFKKLRRDIWEAYIEGQVRILTRFEKDAHYLVFAGNHNQVRQFLKEE